MSELSFFGNLKSLKKDMANMTYKEKLSHIWTYYRWILIVVLILIMLVSILLASLENKRKIMLLGGVTVNVELSEEGRAYLGDDFKEIIGTGNKRETVSLSHTDIYELSNTMVYEDNYYAVMSLLALGSNQEMDFMILDQTGFQTLLPHEAYLPLQEVYTPEELATLEDRLVAVTDEETKTTSMLALDITDCAFIQEHTNEKGPVYFVYVANTPRLEVCREFCDYLLSYEAE